MTVEHWQECEAESWSYFVFTGDIVTIEADTVVDRQPVVHRPLVSEISKILRLVAAKCATALKVDLLATRTVGSQNTNRVADITSVKSGVADSARHFHKMRPGEVWWSHTIKCECVVAFTSASLLVEKIPGVLIRREVHRRNPGTRKNVGIELLNAQRGFQYRFGI